MGGLSTTIAAQPQLRSRATGGWQQMRASSLRDFDRPKNKHQKNGV